MNEQAKERMMILVNKLWECEDKGTIEDLVAAALSSARQEEREKALEEAAKVIQGYIDAYPSDVFIQPPIGEHGKTIDACSARALRAILPNVMRDIHNLKPGGK